MLLQGNVGTALIVAVVQGPVCLVPMAGDPPVQTVAYTPASGGFALGPT